MELATGSPALAHLELVIMELDASHETRPWVTPGAEISHEYEMCQR